MLSLPKNFETFDEKRKASFMALYEAKQRGKKVVGTFCSYTPTELICAAGAIPVGLCGKSEQGIAEAETVLPRTLCPLIKASYGMAMSDQCPYFFFSDGILAETTCDGKKKMYELLGRMKDVYLLHLPQGDREHALEQWTEEVRRFRGFLEERFGEPVSDEAIREAARLRNRERACRRRLMELQKLDPPVSTGYAIYKALEGAGFYFDVSEVCKELTRLADSLEADYAAGKRPAAPGAKRILVTGCPIGGVLEKTVKAIEAAGGVVVCFENCTGIKAMLDDVDADAPDIVAAVAEKYLKIGCAVMTPDKRRMDLLRKLVPEYKVDGVVEIDLQACTAYAVESYTVRGLMEELDVPYMAIETDYSASDSGQLATRLEAFLEML